VTKFKGTFTLMYLDGIKQPSNSGKPLCVWIRGHFNNLTTGSPSRKNIILSMFIYPYVVLQNTLSSELM